MATLPEATTPPELHSGDHLSREEFHRIYEQMPESFRAELIGGVVYVASLLKRRHGKTHLLLGSLLAAYQAQTPGVEAADNTTVLLGEDCEPQPDLVFRILPECGGRSETTDDDYIKGPPEFIAEIAHSSQAIDLHAKYDDYARLGVMEYLVTCLRDGTVRWFDLQFATELQPGEDGVIRIHTFPGLWIDSIALLAGEQAQLTETLEEGLRAPEHWEFVRELEGRR